MSAVTHRGGAPGGASRVSEVRRSDGRGGARVGRGARAGRGPLPPPAAAAVPRQEDEEDRLDTAEGLTIHSRLGCQAVVRGDVVVEIPK